jgi:4-amino-4-deoxy-L-arabinose transferase-like glycosyltransferase
MRERRAWRVAVLSSALILALMGQYRLFYQREDRGLPVVSMLVAGLIILGLSQVKDAPRRKATQPGPGARRAGLWTTLEWIGTTAALLLTLQVARAAQQPASSYYWHTLRWLAAMAGCALLFTQGDEWRRLRALVRAQRSELLLMAGLVTLALLLRLVVLGRVPWPLIEEEGAFGTQALQVLRGQHLNPFATGYRGQPNAFFFLQSAGLKLLGVGPAGLRLPSALAGALLAVPVYALGRLWFGRRVGWIAALLVATAHFPLHYSRVGLNDVADPLLATTTLATLTWGFRSGRRLAFTLAGLALGLGQYFAANPWLTLLLAGGYVLLRGYLSPAATEATTGQKSPPRAQLLVLLIGFFVAFAPLLWTYLQKPDLYFRSARPSQTQAAPGGSTLDSVAGQVARSALAFNYYDARTATPLYDPHAPLLDAASGALWLFGLVVALRRRQEPGAATLLAWIAGAVLVSGVLRQGSAPLHATPALALLVGLGLTALVEALTPLRPHRTALLASSCGLLAAINLLFYFGAYTPRHLYGTVNDETATALGQYLAGHRGQGMVYFAGDPRTSFVYDTVRFLGQGPSDQDWRELSGPLPAIPSDQDVFFIFPPERLDELETLMRDLPGGYRQEFYSDEGRLSFLVYHVMATEP